MQDGHKVQNAGETVFPGVVALIGSGARYSPVRERIEPLFLREWYQPKKGLYTKYFCTTS